MVATVRLNTDESEKQFKDIKRSAKHEALHLLLMRLENRAADRYTTYDDIYESSEEIVYKLEELVED